MLGFISYACNELQQAAGMRGCLPVTPSTNEVGQACRPRRSAQGETGRQLPTSLLPDTSPGDSQYHFLIPTASLPSGVLTKKLPAGNYLCRTMPRIKRCCSGSAPLDGRLLFSFANPTTLHLPDESSRQVLHSSQVLCPSEVCTAPRHCTFGWTWE